MIAQLIGGRLLESSPRSGRGARPAVVASTAVHAGLVALAVVATATPRRLVEPVSERVASVQLPTIPAERVPEARRRAPHKTGFQILKVPPDVPATLPPVDLVATATHEEDFSGRRVPGGVADISFARFSSGPRGDPIDGNLADSSPYLLPGQMGPPYPEELRDDRPDGLVVVRFVIDTLGRVEVPSLSVVAASHPLFAASVRSALGRLRYSPASQAGQLVRVRLEQRFEFHLAAP
jgi:TonB family protein